MLSKYIFGILCVTLLVKWHSVVSQQQNTVRCPFLKDHPLQQNRTEQNRGDDDCKTATALKNCNFSDIYYSINGSCNHKSNPNWGTAGTPFVRLLPAYYSDGLLQLRKSADGSPLPLPRTLTQTFLQDKNVPSNRLNIWFYGFGQFLDHDVTLSNKIKGAPDACCVQNKPATNPADHCLPVLIPENDAFYKQFGVTCIPLERVEHTYFKNCTNLKPAFQINSQTTFLDLSILYGVSEADVNKQRSKKGGKLKVQNDLKNGNQELPPILPTKECTSAFGADNRDPNGTCFMSGDDRTNLNPEILMADVVFLRLHNRIAESLQSINTKWDDDTLFREARRIAIAMYQHVIYSEYLPVLLGPNITSLYRLNPVSSGYANGHDPLVNPQTLASYAAAAARAGHSNVVGSSTYKGSQGKAMTYKLRNVFYKLDFLLSKDVFKNLLNTYIGQTCSEQDQFTSDELNNWTFFSANQSFGIDLSAVDILRGRDFGLPPYNIFREACGLCKLKNFTELAKDIRRPEDVKMLSSLYKSVDDIDYFIGGQLEKPLPGGTLGQSFACIVAESFFRWKFGDRLYYEFQIAGFSPAQLKSIRSTTMSGILCLIDPTMKSIQKNSFLVKSFQNPIVQCNKMPKMDLTPWKK